VILNQARRGFTVIEILVVISIIAFLFGIVGVIAIKSREKAKVTKCKAILNKAKMALEMYKAHWREYPAGAPGHALTWPDPYDMKGVEFDHRFVSERDPGGTKFDQDEIDKTDNTKLVDPWGSRIRYRKVAPERMLLWSVGPDKIDDLGDSVKNTSKAERTGVAPLQQSDDISHVMVDY